MVLRQLLVHVGFAVAGLADPLGNGLPLSPAEWHASDMPAIVVAPLPSAGGFAHGYCADGPLRGCCHGVDARTPRRPVVCHGTAVPFAL